MDVFCKKHLTNRRFVVQYKLQIKKRISGVLKANSAEIAAICCRRTLIPDADNADVGTIYIKRFARMDLSFASAGRFLFCKKFRRSK